MLLQITSQRTVRPPVGQPGKVERLRLSPDGRKIAYVRLAAPDATLEVATLDERGEAHAMGSWSLGPRRARALSWAPGSDSLAVTLGAADPLDRNQSIGIVDIERPELREVTGQTAIWLPSGRGLIMSNTDNREIDRWDLDCDEPEPLHQFAGDIATPGLAVAPDASVLVFTTERADRSVSEVWTLPLDLDGAPRAAVRLLTQVPGAEARITPFFAPKGLTLGMLVVHPSWNKSAIIAVPNLEGEGEVLYEAPTLDAPICPAWCADAGALFFFRATGDVAFELTELDPGSKTMMSLAQVTPEPVSAGPSSSDSRSHPDRSNPDAVRFIDDGSLVVDGGHVATRLRLAPV